ncbi:hypothetical protein GGS20DRAFT_69292 [Poronia punctata]|nr:hypothetical protein GGS20DRAFT_69292 [Poronia punctata]
MDSTVSRKDALERQHRRALSQNSTASTTHTQMTSKSGSTSSSHSRSVTPSNASYTSKYNNAQADRALTSATTRVPSRLARESTYPPTQPMTPVSSLLHERLQQERKAESERNASKFGKDRSSSSMGVRDAGNRSSPIRRHRTAFEHRPRSSHDDDSSQSSMGAKQVEKAVSTLHKQNFDLKLELFHRREKQSALEARVEALEMENRELKEAQGNLLDEITTRDKAIEEAVNMIVKLEAAVEEFKKEREMVLQVAVDGTYRNPIWDECDPAREDTPKPRNHEAVHFPETKAIGRMPSFLSDRSIHTENLRNVVLQNRSSLRHMRKVSEVSSSSADMSEVNRVASPSLSILSESSFMSVYGPKPGQDKSGSSGSMPPDDVTGMDGTLTNRSLTPTRKAMMDSAHNGRMGPYDRRLSMTPRAVNNFSGQVLSLNNVLHNNSPFQRLEKMNDQGSPANDNSRPRTSGRGRDTVPPSRAGRSISQIRNKQGKRETLHRVVTNYPPTHRELADSHTLPPTPDTVASSVLRKHNNASSSQDSLASPETSRFPQVTPRLPPDSAAFFASFGGHDPRFTMHSPVASHNSPRKQYDMANVGLPSPRKDPLSSDLGHLARAAAASPVARPRADSFASDSDSDGGADAHSETETYDYWMRESDKPNGDGGMTGHPRERQRARSPSPDLFSFPIESGGWEPDAMFGALQGSGFMGSPVAALKRDPIDEVPSPPRPQKPDPVENPTNGPRPASRRASLNTHLAGQFLLSTLSGKAGRNSSKDRGGAKLGPKGRSNSIDGSGHKILPAGRTDGGPGGKRSQYPPISGLQSRGRGLGNLLFKRSGSESHGNPPMTNDPALAPPNSPRGLPTPPAHLRHLRGPSGRSSVPPPATTPWASRLQEDELQRATPPPIMRNRPQAAQVDPVISDATDLEQGQATEENQSKIGMPMVGEDAEDAAQGSPAASQGPGGMRKWLGLGMKGNVKTRTGG